MAIIIDDLLFGLAAKYLVPLAGDAIASLFSSADGQATAKTVTTTVAGAALQVAQQVTGQLITDEGSALAAAKAVQADPAKLADYQRAMTERTVAIMAEETKLLAVVNETMRAEVASSDPFVRRMRPTFGYCMAATWTAQMGAASWVIVTRPAEAAAVLNGIAATTMLWTVGLAVLGVYVYKRSAEKGAESSLIGPALKAIKGR